MTTYQTAAAFAAEHGLDVVDVRSLARKGLITGAIRVGGPRSSWAIPTGAVLLTDPSQRLEKAADPAPMGAGSAADTRPNVTDVPNLMSSGGDTPAALARRVENRVRVVRTRPAQALADVVFMAADIAAQHTSDRDARCTRCGWTWPCPDRRALDQLLHHADQITDGNR